MAEGRLVCRQQGRRGDGKERDRAAGEGKGQENRMESSEVGRIWCEGDRKGGGTATGGTLMTGKEGVSKDLIQKKSLSS